MTHFHSQKTEKGKEIGIRLLKASNNIEKKTNEHTETETRLEAREATCT